MGTFDDSLEDDFRRFEEEIRTDPLEVLLARWCRDEVTAALRTCPEVEEVIPSGSLARGTHVGPIHDIDLIVVFKDGRHPGDWGKNGTSAEGALTFLRGMIAEKLQGEPDAETSRVRETAVRNHVVKCELDPVMGLFGVPPADIMPAIRRGDHLCVPERMNRCWIETDPERLVKMVAARERQWGNFREVVRMVKTWAKHREVEMPSLAVEALVLEYCPRPGLFESLSCTDAVARFFEAAAAADIGELSDPAKLCGKFNRGMDYARLRGELGKTVTQVKEAVAAEQAWLDPEQSVDGVRRPEEIWRQVFGPEFARPGLWFWLTGRGTSRYPERAHSWLDLDVVSPREPNWKHERAWSFRGDPVREPPGPEWDGPEVDVPDDGELGGPEGIRLAGPEGGGRGSGSVRRTLAGTLAADTAAVSDGPVIFGLG